LKKKDRFPESTWRWQSDEEFREWVQPHAINEVRYVAQSYRLFSFAECAHKVYSNFESLKSSNERLRGLLELKETNRNLEKARRVAIDICHHGEMLLVWQRRLAMGEGGYGFVHGKEAIEHFKHQTGNPSTYSDLHQLVEDVDGLISMFYELELEDSKFLVADLDLPEVLKDDFYLARDLFSVGFDDVGLFICGRGLEATLRRILEERHVVITKTRKGKKLTISPTEAQLYDVVEVFDRLHWHKKNARFASKEMTRILHWLREARNAPAHPQQQSPGPSSKPRDLAVVVVNAANSLWQTHDSQRSERLRRKTIDL
jgi:hypothetical protein